MTQTNAARRLHELLERATLTYESAENTSAASIWVAAAGLSSEVPERERYAFALEIIWRAREDFTRVRNRMEWRALDARDMQRLALLEAAFVNAIANLPTDRRLTAAHIAPQTVTAIEHRGKSLPDDEHALDRKAIHDVIRQLEASLTQIHMAFSGFHRD